MLSEYGASYDAFDALCDVAFQDGEDGLMFFWKSHMDASGKHSDLLVVAGYLSDRLRWKAFNKAWRPLLTTNGKFAPFHAADFESGNEDFTVENGWTRERRNRVRIRLVDALLGADLHFGIACCVRINDYEQTIPRWMREQKGLGTAYEFAVSVCMSEVAKWCQHNKQPDPVSFIVEHGEGKEGKIQDAFRAAFADKVKQKFFRLGRLVFDTKDGAMGLQAADMLANYTWNEKIGNRPLITPYSRITQAKNLRVGYFDKEKIEREIAADKAGRHLSTPELIWDFKVPDPMEIQVRAAFPEVENMLGELETLAEAFPERVYSLIKHPSSIEKLFSIEAENIAAETNELRITFKPNDFALGAMAALRTANTDSDLSERKIGHN